MPVFIAAHAAAPQIHTVISRMGLCVLAFLLCRWPTCRHQEAAAASRESEYGYGVGAAASSWNRLFDCGQNSEDAQIVWRLQERGRFACDQRHRAETHGKNAQVHHRRQERCAEAGGQRGDVIYVADSLQIATARGAEKLESKSSYAELNNFKKRTDLPTGRDEFRVGHYKTERIRQGIVNIKFSSEELVRFAWLIDVERDLIGDSDAVTFQSYYFLRVIRQNTDVFQAQVDQDLRA